MRLKKGRVQQLKRQSSCQDPKTSIKFSCLLYTSRRGQKPTELEPLTGLEERKQIRRVKLEIQGMKNMRRGQYYRGQTWQQSLVKGFPRAGDGARAQNVRMYLLARQPKVCQLQEAKWLGSVEDKQVPLGTALPR